MFGTTVALGVTVALVLFGVAFGGGVGGTAVEDAAPVRLGGVTGRWGGLAASSDAARANGDESTIDAEPAAAAGARGLTRPGSFGMGRSDGFEANGKKSQ